MKRSKLLSYSFLLITFFTFSQCKKNENKDEPQLPPETTIGAMTFGCKVNDKVFVPKDGSGRPGLYVQYINLGNGNGGGWFLNIPAVDWKSKPIKSVHIETDSLLIVEGMTYPFKNSKGFAQSFYEEGDIYPKLDNDSGNLHVKKFDQINRILSGTFSFIGTNGNGQKINITEGRFDIKY